MLEPEETPQPFDRLTHRMLEDYGTEIVLPFLELEPGQATVATVDTKLTALQARLADKLFLVTERSGERTLFHVEIFIRPDERSAPAMTLYAALVGLLQTQPEYRDTSFDAVAVYLERGPERFAAGRHEIRRRGGRRTYHEFLAVRPWETRLQEFLARCPSPFAALGPFCAGSFEERVIQSYEVLKSLSEGSEDTRWPVLRVLWAAAAQQIDWSAKDMENLLDFLTHEELQQLRPYRQGREKGREEEASRILTRLLVEKFGKLPAWVEPKVREIRSDEDVSAFLRRLLSASRLEDVLQPNP